MSKHIHAVPVSTRAISQRLNRLLAVEGKELRKTRGGPALDALGRYYILGNNSVLSHHINLEQFARKLGVLAEHEQLVVEN
jgi:hypothetical protein